MMHRLLLLFLCLGGLRASSQLQNNYALSTVQEKHALYPVSLRKIRKGVFINCFLDLPSRLSSGSPFAYKFLANLIAAAHQKTPKQNEISQSSKKAIKKTVD